MPVYAVLLDPNSTPGQTDLVQPLLALYPHQRIGTTSWLVESRLSAALLGDELSERLPSRKALLVLELRRHWSVRHAPQAVRWLRADERSWGPM